MMYAKIKVNLKDFYGLRSNLYDFIDLVNSETQPEGYVKFEISNEKPQLSENQVMGYHFQLVDDTLKRTYLAVDKSDISNPKWNLPRTFSKMKCVSALIKAGFWNDVKRWIEEYGLYDLYLAAQDFKEDNEYFIIGKQQISAQLGLTEE